MEDVISQGEDRPPGGRRLMLWILAAAVVAALIVVEHFPHGTARPRHPSAHGYLSVGPRAAIQFRVEGRAVLPANEIPSNVAAWAASARLPRAGDRPDWFWPASGRVAPILGLPEDRNGYSFTRVVGGWAIQPEAPGRAGCFNCSSPAQPSGPTGCGDCTGAPARVFSLPDRAGRAIMVGSASLVAPAAAAGDMWLTSYPAGADFSTTPGVAQQFTSAGRALGGPVILPAGYGIVQGTNQGLLLVSLSDYGSTNSDQLWNPATRRVLRYFGGVVAVGASEVAYEPPCAATCPVHVVNLRTRRDTVIELPIANTVTSGRFSPDGRFLALEVSVGNSLDGTSAIQVVVASMPDGHVDVVPYTSASSDVLVGFGWPSDRDALVVEFRFNSRVKELIWNHATDTAAVADISPRLDPYGLVVG